jgi:hypothetical protein
MAAFIAGAFIASPELRAYAANTVGSADIIDGSIQSIDIGNGQVKTPDIASSAVTNSKIGTNAITTSKINDGAVKNADIENGAVTTSKIQNDAVTSEKLADNVFDNLQTQIDALTTENAAQQLEIDDLTARVEALEEDGSGGGDTQCSDEIDNDTDGLVDLDDPGCTDAEGDNEASLTPACSDGIDNDGDGLVDLEDPGCSTAEDTSEEDPIDPVGTYSLEPVPSYACGLGLVSFSPEQFVFSGTSTLAVDGDGLPQMSGDYAGDGVIDVSATNAGDCTETYSLTGQLDGDATSWTGTFTAGYTGTGCDAFGTDPCIDQSWSLEGERVTET